MLSIVRPEHRNEPDTGTSAPGLSEPDEWTTWDADQDASRGRAPGAQARRPITRTPSTRGQIDGEILRFAALQLGADAETIHADAGRQQTVSEHQQRIGEYLRMGAFDAAVGERLARVIEDEALRLERTASLLARGARLASRRARSRAGRFGVAPRDRGCPTQGPDAADATHGRAPVGHRCATVSMR